MLVLCGCRVSLFDWDVALAFVLSDVALGEWVSDPLAGFAWDAHEAVLKDEMMFKSDEIKEKILFFRLEEKN